MGESTDAARPKERPLKDVALILALVALAFGTVAIVAATYVRHTGPGPAGRLTPYPRAAPDCIIPARVPYADLMQGSYRELTRGRVEILYDFDPLPRVEGRFFMEADLYPQLRDWNTSLRGSKVRTGVVRGEGRLAGEARTRIAFEGPLEVRAELEIVSGAAAVQIATNTASEGYECLISSSGEVRLRSREVVAPEEEGFDDIATLSKHQKEKRREEVVRDLVSPGKIEAPVGRRLRLAFARTEETLSVEIDGSRILEAPLPRPDPWPEGNVALRSVGGRAFWDDVRITGRLSRKWLEERLDMATQLAGTDYYEPDDVWPMARELGSDGREQVRTLAPAGDVDWITVAVPEGAKAVALETRGLELGISTEVGVFDIDGKTQLEYQRLEAAEPGAVRIVVPVRDKNENGGDRVAFYVRIAEPEGRCGTYRIAASAAESPASP